MALYETISDRPLTKLRGMKLVGIEGDPGELNRAFADSIAPNLTRLITRDID